MNVPSPDLRGFDDRAPMYVISAAAQLAGMHPQTLRQYDRMGLVRPSRTSGRGRRYSAQDVAALRYVQRLSQDEGVNLEGIRRILDLEATVEQLRAQVDQLQAEVQRGGAPQPPAYPRGPRVFSAGPGGVHTMTRGTRIRWVRRAPLELVGRRS